MNIIDISKSVNDFKNRQIYKELTPEILATIPDNNLEQAIVDYIGAKLIDYRNTLAYVSNMPSGFQIIYSTWILESEVNNGGFNQFFINPSGQFTEMALMSLKRLNATKHYALLEKAIAIHTQEKESYPLKKLYSRKTLKAFVTSYKYSSLDKCDKEFYKHGDGLSKLRVQYIRENPSDFIGN
ncbi:MAG TPA: DMP19 family protein [Anaerolineales bacterium]|nr:DMP19 family protein [Anaerolineales bacterium]